MTAAHCWSVQGVLSCILSSLLVLALCLDLTGSGVRGENMVPGLNTPTTSPVPSDERRMAPTRAWYSM